jgi:hypothetical protein
MRYIHKWYTPIRVIVFGQVEDWYYSPSYNPKLLPVTEFDNCLAMPYDHVMPIMKKALLERLS